MRSVGRHLNLGASGQENYEYAMSQVGKVVSTAKTLTMGRRENAASLSTSGSARIRAIFGNDLAANAYREQACPFLDGMTLETREGASLAPPRRGQALREDAATGGLRIRTLRRS